MLRYVILYNDKHYDGVFNYMYCFNLLELHIFIYGEQQYFFNILKYYKNLLTSFLID